MQAHREVELKWALMAADHGRLRELLRHELGPPVRLDQRNRFYDSTDRRLRAGMLNLRLRDENGSTLLTCKRRIAQSGGLHQHEEWECWLDTSTPDFAALPLPDAWRAALAGAPVELIGGFSNTRDEFRSGSDLLCLDRTDFPGARQDHELEIETSDPTTSCVHWAARLQAWGIPWSPQPLTKFARLLAILTNDTR
jgi:uncharacterized protein YjbK